MICTISDEEGRLLNRFQFWCVAHEDTFYQVGHLHTSVTGCPPVRQVTIAIQKAVRAFHPSPRMITDPQALDLVVRLLSRPRPRLPFAG